MVTYKSNNDDLQSVLECVSSDDEVSQKKIVFRDLKPENILLDSSGHIAGAVFPQ